MTEKIYFHFEGCYLCVRTHIHLELSDAFGIVVHKAVVFHQYKCALSHRLGPNSAQPVLRYIANSLDTEETDCFSMSGVHCNT